MLRLRRRHSSVTNPRAQHRQWLKRQQNQCQLVGRSAWNYRMPISIEGEADRCPPPFATQAIAAVDPSPIRIMGPVGLPSSTGALRTHRHHVLSLNLRLAVPPNGICMAILPILAGGRHEERALDDADACLRFSHLGQTDTM